MKTNYLELAATLARDAAAPATGPSVRVELRLGCASFPRATASQFEAGRLTITGSDTDAEIAVYEPGDWRDVTVYDRNGNLDFHWTASVPVRPILPFTARELEGV